MKHLFSFLLGWILFVPSLGAQVRRRWQVARQLRLVIYKDIFKSKSNKKCGRKSSRQQPRIKTYVVWWRDALAQNAYMYICIYVSLMFTLEDPVYIFKSLNQYQLNFILAPFISWFVCHEYAYGISICHFLYTILYYILYNIYIAIIIKLFSFFF